MESHERPGTVLEQAEQAPKPAVRCAKHRETPGPGAKSASECTDHPVSLEQAAGVIDICVSWGLNINPHEVAQIEFDRLLKAGVIQYHEGGFAFCEEAPAEAVGHIVETHEAFAQMILARLMATRRKALYGREIHKGVNQTVANNVIELLLRSGELERVGQSFRFEDETIEWDYKKLCQWLEWNWYYTRIRRRSVNSMLDQLAQEGRIQRQGLRYVAL